VILQRSIFLELLRALLFASALLAVICALALGWKLLHEGLDIVQIGRLLPLAVPGMTAVVLPVGLLAAVTFVYGRMGLDQEYFAAQWAGIPPAQLWAPAGLLGLFCVVPLYFLSSEGVPRCRRVLEEAIRFSAQELPFLRLSIGQKQFELDGGEHEGEGGRRFHRRYRVYVDRIDAEDPSRLHQVTLFQNDEHLTSLVAHAERGEIRLDRERRTVSLVLKEVEWAPIGPESRAPGVPSRSEQMPLALSLMKPGEGRVDPNDLTGAELASYLHKESREGEAWLAGRTELTRRWADAFAPLAFVCVGIPLGLWARSGNILLGFGLGLLPVFGIYYPLLMASTALATSGRWDPSWAPWAAPVGTAAAGAGLLRWVGRK
jgi:lipopolysaccharide export system permease protein